MITTFRYPIYYIFINCNRVSERVSEFEKPDKDKHQIKSSDRYIIMYMKSCIDNRCAIESMCVNTNFLNNLTHIEVELDVKSSSEDIHPTLH